MYCANRFINCKDKRVFAKILNKMKKKFLLGLIVCCSLLSVGLQPTIASETKSDFEMIKDAKNKWGGLVRGCKEKEGHYCEVGGRSKGILTTIIKTIF